MKKRENKIISKPWITRGIKTSLKKRDKFYKQMIKAKNKQQKCIKHESYKKYSNKIIELLRQSKQTINVILSRIKKIPKQYDKVYMR